MATSLQAGHNSCELEQSCTAGKPYPAGVRTRTLLILAVVCGFAILLAGGLQLLRIANQDSDDEQYHQIGDAVDVGDLVVAVVSSSESDGIATVAINLAGVDDPDGTDEFRLVIPGESLQPFGRGDGQCGATTVEEQDCVLTFNVGDAPGGTRILLYRRGDDVARWALDAA